LHADQLNTPRLATNSSGTVVWRWDSDAFGVGDADLDPDLDSTETNVRLRFPGQYYDEETGSHYNYFRDYDAIIGRYVQSDPIGLAGGLNTYVYGNANPLRYTDPYGLWTWPSPRDVVNYWGETFGGTLDFFQGYVDQWRATNTVGRAHNGWANQDVYFHCRANCESAKRGPAGDAIAQCLSNARENWDEFWGQQPSVTVRDQAANMLGRHGGTMNTLDSCQLVCGSLRPGGSFPATW
jgi:RHS repeat-associated protein